MILRILESYGERIGYEQLYEDAVRGCETDHFKFHLVNHRQELKIDRAWDPQFLDMLYRQNDPRLLAFYDKVEKLCDKYDIFVVNHENVYHPEFVKRLSNKIYTVLYSGDDPESSYKASMPYVWAFDHILCYAVYYNEDTLMSEKFIEWGAKRADHRPFGYLPHRNSPYIDPDDLFSKQRSHPITYVGGIYNKLDRLMAIKKHFGDRFRIYGNWGGVRGDLSRLKKFKILAKVRPISDADLVNVYRDTMIGINMHMSYGPSNLRMWELPINGALQITDNPSGTKIMWDAEKEIICYNNTSELISLIEYYLQNDAERINIAKHGYYRAIADYSFRSCYHAALEKITRGLHEKTEMKFWCTE